MLFDVWLKKDTQLPKYSSSFDSIYKESGTISHKPCHAGIKGYSRPRLKDIIEKQIEEDNETTWKELGKILRTEGIEAYVSSVLH